MLIASSASVCSLGGAGRRRVVLTGPWEERRGWTGAREERMMTAAHTGWEVSRPSSRWPAAEMLCMAKKAEQVSGGRPWREVRQEQGHLRPSVTEEAQKKGQVPTLKQAERKGMDRELWLPSSWSRDPWNPGQTVVGSWGDRSQLIKDKGGTLSGLSWALGRNRLF